ncbi:MAG: AIR synthase-related protein, partial [Chloroflexota bacterium]
SARNQADLLTRSTAKPGDKIAVTGYLGAAAAGLQMLLKHLTLDAKTATTLKKAFRRPQPRVTEGQKLVDLGVKTAIDISDGLLADLRHICTASHVGARIKAELVPVQSEVSANFGDNALALALSGGEDYELLFTAPAGIMEKVKAALPCPATVIGEIEAGKAGEATVVDHRGQTINLPKAGWEHFTMGSTK